ncbi:hypothetical protein [Caulobacter mirabilis]|uniref:Uncharacterized protein n=1 Tax=Caulobacter mirabilis TaxID=69666 RepID=A0A2D2AUQ2_9CAUL|nr:hypothetical protein [Caulobacter mirabilis]ATQ41726.1 hypothetical protein CSW64_04540 [Caulobacter mirabilis]
MDQAPPPPAVHACAADAIQRGKALLAFHFGETDHELQVSGPVKVLPPVKSLRGKGKFDVLEVWGYIYKGQYRMRFLYAQMEGCVLMGQEVLEAADPY